MPHSSFSREKAMPHATPPHAVTSGETVTTLARNRFWTRRRTMRSNRHTVGIPLAVAILTIAFQGHALGGGRYSAMTETEDFRSASVTKVFKHPVSEPWTGARLKVAMRVEHGDAVVRLIDNAGATRWEKTFGPGHESVDQTFAGKGIWRVELRLRNATGRYDIKLIAI
jgi:hypothetical protein